MMKRVSAIILALAMALTLAACGGGGDTDKDSLPSWLSPDQPVESPDGSPDNSPEPSPDAAPTPEQTPSGINPLTGMPIEPEYINDRPLAIMLNNLKAAQPQYSTSQADIIYEVPAEGMVTRMIALYQHPVAETIGSIRSTRSYYVDIAQGHDAILVHAGASPQAYALMKSRKTNHIDGVLYDGKYFWRDKQRIKNAGYEHSLFTSADLINQIVDKLNMRRTHKDGFAVPLEFTDDGTPYAGETAGLISIKYPSGYKKGTFEYDPQSKKYKISQYGKDYVDGATGIQVESVNVLFLKASMNVISGDDAGRIAVKLTNGVGYYANGGKYIPIKWTKASNDSSFAYETLDGQTLKLGRGNSYVCVYPSGTELDFGQPDSGSETSATGQ